MTKKNVSMTKQNYILLAHVMHSSKPCMGPDLSEEEFEAQVEQWRFTVRVLSAQLSITNPRFKMLRFEADCNG